MEFVAPPYVGYVAENSGGLQPRHRFAGKELDQLLYHVTYAEANLWYRCFGKGLSVA